MSKTTYKLSIWYEDNILEEEEEEGQNKSRQRQEGFLLETDSTKVFTLLDNQESILVDNFELDKVVWNTEMNAFIVDNLYIVYLGSSEYEHLKKYTSKKEMIVLQYDGPCKYKGESMHGKPDGKGNEFHMNGFLKFSGLWEDGLRISGTFYSKRILFHYILIIFL